MTSRKPRHPKRMINPPRWYKSWEQVEAKAWDIATNQNQQIRQVLMGESIACELSREAYEDAQMHARTNHALVGELRCANEMLTLANDKLKAEIETLLGRQTEMQESLFLSDALRRQGERDILAQQAELARWKPFNVRSKALG
jgi:hypothetical protein